MTTHTGDNEQQDLEEVKLEGSAHSESRVRLGERLSQARQAKEISIADASDRLKIRKVYLESLESGDWSQLPEEVYIMGFLRQYIALLGVDLGEEVEALKTGEYQLTKPFTMPDPPVAMNRTWALVAGACFLLLLILFNVVGEGEKDQSPPAANSSLPLASPAAPEAAAPAETPASTGLENESDAAQSEAPMPTDTATDSAQDTAPGPEPAEPATLSAASKTEQAAPDTTALPAGSGHQYELTAVDEDVWLQLHNPDGTLLKEALLRSGQSLRLDTEEDHLLLTAGNPLALSVRIDGQTVNEAGTLGEKGKVLHDYRLPQNESGSSH